MPQKRPRRGLQAGIGRPRPDESAELEIEHHIAELTDRLVAEGKTAEEARREAERRFGNRGRHLARLRRLERSRCAHDRLAAALHIVHASLRSVVRMVRREPGFAAAVVLTFALGIGANATMYGIIDRLHEQQGSLIEEGDILTTLSDNDVMWVYFNVPEARYLEYRDGLHQVVHVDGAADLAGAAATPEDLQVELVLANGNTFNERGAISAVEADFNNETGNIAFRATFANPTGLLRHGETGNIIVTTKYPDAQLIPQKATFEILDRRYVFVVDDEGVVRQRQISVAAELPHAFILDGGLEDTDHVLLEGLRKVQDGKHVDVRFEEPAEVFAQLKWRRRRSAWC